MRTQKQRNVMVTGATSGIGRATALHLAAEGWRVFAGYRSEADASSLRREGGERLVPVRVDVTDHSQITSAAAAVERELAGEGLQGLVNNAGIGLATPVEYIDLDELRQQFEVNVFGQIAVTQAFLPLIRRGAGRIVNIGSVGARIAMPFGGVLCASKSAFEALSDALRMELHASGIHVCIIEPGSIRTPAVGKTLGGIEERIDRLPADGRRRYGDMLRSFNKRAVAREENGSPPEVVAGAVAEALLSPRPRARYPVGKDSKVLVTLQRVLPDGLLDRLRYRLFGLPLRFGAARR